MTMRQRANVSLLLLTLIFLLTLFLQWKLNTPWWTSALLFIAEAGMVGALADWFAVSALFRHPLGMKWIPHTAIVPRNRDKLVEGVVYLVEEELLNKQMIEQQLQKVTIVNWLIKWGDNKFTVKWLEQLLARVVPKLLGSISIATTSQQLNNWLLDEIQSKKLTPQLQRLLVYIIRNGYDQRLIDILLEVAQRRVLQADMKGHIKKLLEEKASDSVGDSWLSRTLFSLAKAADAVNFDEATDIIYRDLLLLLAQLKDHDHELRVMLKDQIHQLVDVLGEEDSEKAIEQWKQNALQQLSLVPMISQLLSGFVQSWTDENADQHTNKAPMLQKWLARLIYQYWNWFKQDKASQQLLEQHLKTFVSHLIEQEHKVIGKIVRSTLATFSEERLVEFIESKVDVDLQRIRVNGAVIGAAIGAILYGFLYGVYEPLLQWLQLK